MYLLSYKNSVSDNFIRAKQLFFHEISRFQIFRTYTNSDSVNFMGIFPAANDSPAIFMTRKAYFPQFCTYKMRIFRIYIGKSGFSPDAASSRLILRLLARHYGFSTSS